MMPPETLIPAPSQETASLVKQLAGPSTGKAGLAQDQSEINRIIAEASKGSKFYENEKRKDKELTERIAKLIKQRDAVIKGADLHKIEAGLDSLLRELESQRDLSQAIVHCDMDSFYASVELLFDPTLAEKPFAVGHGVLTTASYEARKHGVRSGMPGFIAKKLCPDLIVVKNNFSRYSDVSEKVMGVLGRYDPNFLAAGCDEAYLNITPYCDSHGMTAPHCVEEIRKTVFRETKLTMSAGIAPNKMLAKICSDKNKPNGQFQLRFDRESIIAFMHDLPIRKVPGIGRVNERVLLETFGIKTCGDIFKHRATISLMDKGQEFGLKFLLQTYLGIASNSVLPRQRDERKSIGSERTFSPISGKEHILQKLQEISEELEADMEENGWAGSTITLKYKTEAFEVFTRAKHFDRWITKKEDLFSIGEELLRPELPLTLRLIGLRATKLKDLRPPPASSGIKRFFASAKPESSRKKAKLDDNEPFATENLRDLDDAMPSLCELEDDDDVDFEEDDIGENTTKAEADGSSSVSSSRHAPSTTKPQSTSAVPSTKPSSSRPTSVKPKSTQTVITTYDSARVMPKESQQCPICGRTLDTDNQGLNSHVDFCLSRGAIRQAQAETVPVKKYNGASKGGTKGKKK